MSWKVIELIHLSKIDPRLRHLAQTLAIFANDDGREIRPGVAKLKQAMGVEEAAVYEGLRKLLQYGLLERDGYHRHTRRFKFNLGAVGAYEPSAERTRAGLRDAARRREANKKIKAEAEPSTIVQGSESDLPAQTLHVGAGNPAGARTKPYTRALLTLHDGAADLPDLPDRQDEPAKTNLPGAGAPVGSHQEKGSEKNKPAPSSSVEPVPFKVYAAIATRAIDCAVRDRPRDDSITNIVSHFKRLCGEQQLPFDSEIVQKATDAAVVAREKVKNKFAIEHARVKTAFVGARAGGRR